MSEVDLITWATNQGVAVVFALAVYMLLRDMIREQNEKLTRLLEAVLKLLKDNDNSGQRAAEKQREGG